MDFREKVARVAKAVREVKGERVVKEAFRGSVIHAGNGDTEALSALGAARKRHATSVGRRVMFLTSVQRKPHRCKAPHPGTQKGRRAKVEREADGVMVARVALERGGKARVEERDGSTDGGTRARHREVHKETELNLNL